jgi:hypothetical protein
LAKPKTTTARMTASPSLFAPFSQFASSFGNAEMFPDLDGLESDIQRFGSRRRAFRRAPSDACRPAMSDPSLSGRWSNADEENWAMRRRSST